MNFEELFKEGQELIDKKDYKMAEDIYAKIAKNAQVEENYFALANSLKFIGNIYLYSYAHQSVASYNEQLSCQYYLVKSTALFNCALNICKQKKITELIEELRCLIVETEQSFIKLLLDPIIPSKELIENQHEKHMLLLKEIRGKNQQQFKLIDIPNQNLNNWQDIKLLCEDIVNKMKQFIIGLWDECLQVFPKDKQLPCDYTIIAFGSMARGEMTPFSDFEWGILLSESSEDNKYHFKSLANFLYLKVINLGETILPAINIESLNGLKDYITPRGFSFDGQMSRACKTPFGKTYQYSDGYELIGSPEELARFQNSEEDAVKKDPLLPSEIYQFIVITGEVTLAKIYQTLMDNILNETLRKQRALQLMEQDLHSYSPIFDYEHSGKIYDVKKDLYRPISIILDGFGLYYGLHFVGKINSGWEKIDEMIKNGCLSEEGAINLKNILSHSIFLRLKTYLLKGKQSEVAAICEQTNQQFNLNETEKNHLIKYYCTLIPFLEKMQEFCSSNEELSLFLKKQAFFDNSLKTSAVVYGRLHESENAILCLEKYLQEHNNDFEAMLNLGDSYRLCSKRDNAINIYTKTIDLLNVDLNSCSQKHKLILSHCKCNRGTLYRYLERYDEALHDYQYVENFFKEIYPSNSHPDVAAIYNNIGLIYRIKKDFSQAEFYYKQALEISRNIYNSNQSICIAHCLINFARFLYEKEQSNKIDVKQALEYLKEALNIVELNYGNTHESRVQILADLGITYACDGDFTRGIEYCQRALKVWEEIYKGQKNSELLTIYRNIMLIYRDNIKDYTKALHYSNLCLEIATEIKHPELPKVSSDHEELKTGQLEEPSMFASKSNNTLPKTTIDVPAIVKLEDIQQVVTESRRIAEQRGNIGSRTIDGWELKDVPDEGNCFYEAIADQLQRINHRVIQEVPKGTEIHNWLRLHIQGSNFQDRQWAEDETIYQLIRQFPEIALAIVDTRNSQIGFVYYYHNGEVSLTNTGDNYDPVILAEKTIIKIAATGNHFLSVISHPQLNIGAIIPDTDLPQETQRMKY